MDTDNDAKVVITKEKHDDAVKIFSGMLARDAAREDLFTRVVMGEGELGTMPIQRLNLEGV